MRIIPVALALTVSFSVQGWAQSSSEVALKVPPGWSATGVVQTVTGPVEPSKLGFTQMHEHLFIDLLEPTRQMGYPRTGPIPPAAQRFIQETERVPVPRTEEQIKLWDTETLDLELLPVLRQQQMERASGRDGGYFSKTLMVLDDAAVARSELLDYRKLGGRTIVDVTTEGLGRKPVELRKLSDDSGINIVMGTGWYRWPYHAPIVESSTVDQLAQIMVDDITTGVAGTDVKAGIIGEIAIDPTSVALPPDGQLLPVAEFTSRVSAQEARANDIAVKAQDAYHPRELKVLRAAARASRLTGAAITLHAIGNAGSYLDILEEEGADLTRVVVGHSEDVFLEPALVDRFLKRGVVLQADYSLQYYATVGPVSSRQREILDAIVAAVKRGYANQIVLSLDVCIKLGLKKYGGGGYSWLIQYVLPYLRDHGVSETQIQQMMVQNPQRLLTFVAPKDLAGK